MPTGNLHMTTGVTHTLPSDSERQCRSHGRHVHHITWHMPDMYHMLGMYITCWWSHA